MKLLQSKLSSEPHYHVKLYGAANIKTSNALLRDLLMPSRKLCNDVQREVAKLGLDRVSGLFCYVPLHNFRDGIDLLELFGVKTERSYSASLRN